MKLLKSVIITFIFANISLSLFAQDSTNVQDPQPVVITQEGYSQEADPQDVPLNERSFKQRLRLGGGISNIQIGNKYGNPTVIGLSPMVGYQATNKMIVGAGVSYIFIKYRDIRNNINLRDDLAALRGFVRYDLKFLQELIGQGFLTGEVERYQSIQAKEKYRPAVLVGAGMGIASGFGLTLLYDVNYKLGQSINLNSLSGGSSPWVIRVNGFF